MEPLSTDEGTLFKSGPGGRPDLLPGLTALHDSGRISHQDYYLAQTLGRAFPETSPLSLVSCALVSHALVEGHICLDLTAMAGQDLFEEADGKFLGRLPDIETWTKDLSAAPCVAAERPESEAPGRILKQPLVLDRDRHLYLAKYYDFQQRLIRNITERTAGGFDHGMDSAFIQAQLENTFSGQDPDQTRGQRRAVQKALENRFLVISGGPGTGKTHVTAIIRSLLEKWRRDQGLPAPAVLCLAPTGKAAERMAGGRTIHSVLKPRPAGVGFIHGADNPLYADLVIVDEASMIDIALMARLMEAVPMNARLILLGDRHQLSPVQAGAIFSDLCTVKGLEPCRASLSFNFRSAGKSGIDALSKAVNENNLREVNRILTAGAAPDVTFIDTGNAAAGSGLVEAVLVEGYREVARARTPEQALETMDRFRVLCAHNQGPSGTLQVNHLCQKLLRSHGTDGINRPFLKQIVMVTQNDYGRGLFNGDTGVVFQEESMHPRVWFRERETIRQFPLSQIPSHEAAYAVTIHKSQGSEFDTVLILIPDRLSPVVTRQLLYTGITRARSKVIIAGRLDLICQAVTLSPVRRSNLAAGIERSLGHRP